MDCVMILLRKLGCLVNVVRTRCSCFGVLVVLAVLTRNAVMKLGGWMVELLTGDGDDITVVCQIGSDDE